MALRRLSSSAVVRTLSLFPAILAEGPGCTIHFSCTGEIRVIAKCMTSRVRRTPPVDNTDWLKTAAIIAVAIGHFGHFFMEDDHWWAVFGRVAAPAFFFLQGYAESRTIPLNWIWLGVILTLLNSWNADWRWGTNILLSYVLIRLARPYVQALCSITAGSPLPSWSPHSRGAPAGGGRLSITVRRAGCGPCLAYTSAGMADQRSAKRKSRHRLRAG